MLALRGKGTARKWRVGPEMLVCGLPKFSLVCGIDSQTRHLMKEGHCLSSMSGTSSPTAKHISLSSMSTSSFALTYAPFHLGSSRDISDISLHPDWATGDGTHQLRDSCQVLKYQQIGHW